MAEQIRRSWLRRKVEDRIRKSFLSAYEHVKVDPGRFLMQLRTAHGLPISSFQGVYNVEIARLDHIAADTIHSGMRMAAAQGAGFGLGGAITLVPDLSLLAAITLRTIQKLSLIYGFEFNSDHEVAELWIAAASAAGVDISRELIEKEVVNKFVPRVIQRIAVRASGEVVEKWAGRLIPVVSSLLGAALNYYFIRAWGERAKKYFRSKHMEMRQKAQQTISAQPETALTSPIALPPSGTESTHH